MTRMTDVVLRWFVVAVLGVATVGLFLISMRGNYLYGYSIGQSDEKRILFGWANVAADVWKAFGLVAVTILWRGRYRHVALAGTVAWLVCLCSGLNSAIGLYVQDRSTFTGTREAQHTNYEDAQNDLRRVTEQLRSLASHRSIGEIDGLIGKLLAQPIMLSERVRGTVGTLSDECRKADMRTATACTEVASLRSERAIAEEGRTLERRTQQLRMQIATLRERGGSLTPDPIGEFYAWATRGLLSVRDIGFGFPLFFALLIEVVSAFGPVTVIRFAELSTLRPTMSDGGTLVPGTARHVVPRPALSFMGRGGSERVAAWMAQRAVPRDDGGAVSIEELYEDYRAWCVEANMTQVNLLAFAAEFDRLREMPELSNKIRKFGNRYYGIALTEPSGG